MDNICNTGKNRRTSTGKHSKLFDKAFQFILAMTFSMINQNTGFMKSLSSPGNFSGTGCSCYISASDGDCCDSSGGLVSAHTLAASIGIFAVSAMDFPDHVYFLYQTGTKDGVLLYFLHRLHLF